jgi:hypothetical protein
LNGNVFDVRIFGNGSAKDKEVTLLSDASLDDQPDPVLIEGWCHKRCYQEGL